MNKPLPMTPIPLLRFLPEINPDRLAAKKVRLNAHDRLPSCAKRAVQLALEETSVRGIGLRLLRLDACKGIRPQHLQIHATRLWNAVFSPVGNGLICHITNPRDLSRASKRIDNVRIVQFRCLHLGASVKVRTLYSALYGVCQADFLARRQRTANYSPKVVSWLYV